MEFCQESNEQKEAGVDFDEAATVFYDQFSLTVDDPHHSIDEQRFNIIGQSNRGRLLIVTFTERPNELRIIRAQKPTRSERKQYEEGHN